MNIRHEEFVMVLLGKEVCQIDASTSMSRAVTMIYDGLNVGIDVGMNVFSSLSMEETTLDDMKGMGNDTGRDKGLSIVVKVQSPRVAETMGHDFETLLDRMVTEDTPVDELSTLDFLIGRKRIAFLKDSPPVDWLANGRWGSEALASVEPAIWSPNETVQHFVAIADPPTGQVNFNLIVGPVVTVSIRNKE